jgi:hypothetical protein
MGIYYHSLYTRGDRCTDNRRMYVTLYPNTPNELDNVKKDTDLTTTIKYGADQLYDANSVSYYDIQRFHAEDYQYPNVNTSDSIWLQFEDYLRGNNDDGSETNGTGDDLKSLRGCHVLIHSDGCSTSLASGEGGADDCRESHNTEPFKDDDGGSAFSRGVMAWNSVPKACADAEKGRNSAIQEWVHQFIRAQDDDVQGLMCDADSDGSKEDYEEHTLGKINSYYDATPMLTYHVNEHAGCCEPETYHDGNYTQDFTSCTKDAVDYTSRDQCDPQGTNIC